MGNPENLINHPNFQNNGFDKRPADAKKGGRPKGVKNGLIEILNSEKKLVIKATNVSKIHSNGDVTLNVPEVDEIALRLVELTRSKQGSTAISAIKLIMEHLDGKPKQALAFEMVQPEPFDIMGPAAEQYKKGYDRGYEDAKKGLEKQS